MKKLLLSFLILTFFTTQPTIALANTKQDQPTYTTMSIQYTYIYKVENNKLYRKLINARTGETITPWELVNIN